MTLIEIMVVIVDPRPHRHRRGGERGRQRQQGRGVERAKTDVHMIASQGVDTFKVMKGRYPTTEEGLEILIDEKS